MLKLSQKLKVTVPDLPESKIDDELVMMSIQHGVYYNFNKQGVVIWGLIKAEELTGDQICERLQHRFKVDRAQCEQETLAFLQRLLDQQLIKVV